MNLGIHGIGSNCLWFATTIFPSAIMPEPRRGQTTVINNVTRTKALGSLLGGSQGHGDYFLRIWSLENTLLRLKLATILTNRLWSIPQTIDTNLSSGFPDTPHIIAYKNPASANEPRI